VEIIVVMDEKNGYFNFLNILYKKVDDRSFFGVRVANVVFLKYGHVFGWFSSEFRTNELIKKKKNILISDIKKAFTIKNKSGVCACFRGVKIVNTDGSEKKKPYFDFFNCYSLESFLMNDVYHCSGFLRLFIEPDSSHNCGMYIIYFYYLLLFFFF
jgi:hypothetical protein